MTRAELIQYSKGLKSMVHGLQAQLAKALEAMVKATKKEAK